MDAIISSGVDVVQNYAFSYAKEEFKSVWYLKDNIVRISQEVDTFIQDQGALMEAAEKKQLQDEGVRKWVTDLKNVRYDLEDAQSDYRVVVSVEDGQGVLTRCMRLVCGIPLSCLGVISDPVTPRIQIAHRLRSINKNLVEINRQKARLRLDEGDGCRGKVGEGDESDPPGPSMWQYDEQPMIGRTVTKNQIKKALLGYAGNEGSWSKLFVIGVVGAGGMGKTTLAHNIYNDEDVVKAFPENHKKWLYVGEKNFDIKRVMNEIIGEGSQLVSEDALHKAMRAKFKDQSLLIVLDDVWCHTGKEWKLLQSSLSKGAKAHALIVTTRNKAVARAVRHDSEYLEKVLVGLPFKECMDIFERGAFMGDGAERYRDDLEGLSKRVVQKLKGNPLAATMMGTFLNKHLGNRQKWFDVIKDWAANNEGDVVDRVAGLSYFHLKPELKPCFAYCAMFPKGKIFDKETLVWMWIAQGYVRPNTSRGRLMEHSGSDHFDDLYQRSFFQKAEFPNCYIMHDLIHDFAQKVFTEGCQMDVSDTEDGTSYEEIRHLSFYDYGTDQLERLDKFNKLRTLTLLKSYYGLVDASHLVRLAKFKYLRLLALRVPGLAEFPDSIRHLKFLRYLDISRTKITALPEFVCDLVELQYLKLPYNYCALPEGMNKLINLRFIEAEARGNEVPQFKGIGRLTSLQGCLLKFKVRNESGWKISELKGLNHLHGRLVVRGLRDVTGKEEAEQACLTKKEYLKELILNWTVEEEGRLLYRDDGQVQQQHVRNDEVEGQVLEGLVPPPNLEALSIYRNRGARFPGWMEEHDRRLIFSTLVKLKLVDCCKWECLPTLGRWPCLKELVISGALCVKKIGPQFYGTGNNNNMGSYFRRLETLEFGRMSLWEEWEMPAAGEIDSSRGGGGRRHVFPSLKELRIHHCPKLRSLAPFLLRHLADLERLVIRECAELALSSWEEGDDGRGWTSPSRLKELDTEGCPKLAFMVPILCRHSTNLERLVIGECAQEGDDDDERGWMLPSGLKWLTVEDNSWKLLPSLSHLTALQELTIRWFPDLRCIPPGVLHSLRSLEYLSIMSCPAIESLPDGGLPPSLKMLYIFGLPNLRCIPPGVLHSLRSLEYLRIIDCPAIESLPDGGLPPSLNSLTIYGLPNLRCIPPGVLHGLRSLKALSIRDCPAIESLPDGGLPPSLKWLYIVRCPLLEGRCREGGPDRPKIPATTYVCFTD